MGQSIFNEMIRENSLIKDLNLRKNYNMSLFISYNESRGKTYR